MSKWIVRNIAALAALIAANLPPLSLAQGQGVSVRMHFESVPAEMLKAPAVPPEEIKACLVRQALLNGLVGGKPRAPLDTCIANTDRPLVATKQTEGGLIVRP